MNTRIATEISAANSPTAIPDTARADTVANATAGGAASARAEHLLQDSRWIGKLFNGAWITAAAGGSRDVIEPGTGQPMARAGFGTASDIDAAALAAAGVQKSWAGMSGRDKGAILRKAAHILERDFDALAVLVARETGGILPKGQHEVREAAALLYSAAGLASAPRGEVLANPPGRLSYARRVARGVVGIISPFNFPLILSMRAVAPALATGNAVVLKPDPHTPLSGGVIIARALEEAGLPAGVLHVVPGGADAGEALCLSPQVHMIQFTGSTAVGRRVGELAGKTLKKVSLELGGNNALIILDDADLELAVNNAVWGAFLHQGQICMASSRIFVQTGIAADFTRRLAEHAAHLPVGDPAGGQVALGPVIHDKQLQRIKSIVADSVEAGATIEAGGRNQGLFHEATVLSGVKPGMRAFGEETFGPVASLIVFGTDEEAVALANQHEGALAAAVISRSVGRAMRITDRLNAGMVHVNDQTVNDDGNNPFGGPGVAGGGSSVGGPADLDEYTAWQWVTIKDTPPRYPF
jgi:benzaldehyde dehydrogenase (NAD)